MSDQQPVTGAVCFRRGRPSQTPLSVRAGVPPHQAAEQLGLLLEQALCTVRGVGDEITELEEEEAIRLDAAASLIEASRAIAEAIEAGSAHPQAPAGTTEDL